jgi:hypothetical protein
MFGIHFKHVLILTLLAGIAYTLPQVKDGLSDSFSSIYVSNQAALFDFPNRVPVSSSSRMMNNQIKPAPVIGVGEMKKMMIVPEEIVFLLVKEGIIPQDKAPQAIKLLREKMFNNQPIPPLGASTTRPNIIRVQIATSTKPMMRLELQRPQYDSQEVNVYR